VIPYTDIFEPTARRNPLRAVFLLAKDPVRQYNKGNDRLGGIVVEASKKLYIMISKTDTGIGNLIRKVSGYPYNHVSMTLDEKFHRWVSFARFHQDTALYGGFIVEPSERFLAKGQTIDIRVFALDLTPGRYEELKQLFAKAGTPDNGYIYNYLELLTLSIGIKFPIRDAYSCLGFSNAVMGTDFRSIHDLDRQLTPHLFYNGTLNDLSPDTGDRSDLYFTRLGLCQGLDRSIKTLGTMFHRIIANDKEPSPVG